MVTPGIRSRSQDRDYAPSANPEGFVVLAPMLTGSSVVERRPVKAFVGGSNPSRSANSLNLHGAAQAVTCGRMATGSTKFGGVAHLVRAWDS